ncbi:ciliary microtubule inner protein 4 [Mixophyes fleayi]|uniref:ciliary microtubule inner protein 4 n=1 Tax=Mixophyes fleayi TaxID=3061075 RepID=UPI003F4DC36A
MWSNADQCHRDSKSRGGDPMSGRNDISQRTLENKQKELGNLIPAYIRHKYGSSVVDKLISPEQVRSCLRELQDSTQYSRAHGIHRRSMTSWLTQEYPRNMYDDLGQCLRSNIFPGVPINQRSLTQDSYTAAVNERGILDKHNKHHWYGRKTDDLAIWSQMLMKRNVIDKILQSQSKPFCIFPLPIRKNLLRDDPPPLPPPIEKPRKWIHKTKTKKPEVQPPPIAQPKQEDDFWDFYDKPIQ